MYQKNQIQKIKIFFLIIFAFTILSYMIFRSSDYFIGPILNLKSPLDGEVVNAETFFVEGNIKNVKEIKLNDREINIDLEGNFKEEIIARSPYTIVTISAIDKYGEKLEKVLRVVKSQ